MLKVLRRIKDIRKPPDANNLSQATTKPLDEDLDDLDSFFELSNSSFIHTPNDDENMTDASLIQQIRQLGRQEKIPMKSNIFEHYNDLRRNNKIDEDLYQMAIVILAAPATQVSVERAFSALGIILTPRRMNLRGSKLNDILVCRLNQEIFSLVDFDQMQKE